MVAPNTSKQIQPEADVAAPAHEYALRLENCVFAWPGQSEPVLRISEFCVKRGQRIFLSGPSGGGKSTLLSIIAGILQPTSGSVYVNGTQMNTLRKLSRDAFRGDTIGLVFQQFNLIPHLSMLDNVLLPCRFSPARAKRAAAKDGSPEKSAQRLLEHLGLMPDLWNRRVTRLSVGQQQRVAAARALVGLPPLVMADEPTSALDADHRADFLHLLLRECAEADSSLLFVSHDWSLTEYFSQSVRLAEINKVAKDTPDIKECPKGEGA